MDQSLGGNWKSGNIDMGLTFDDILMIPQHSDIESRSHCNLNTLFSKSVPLKIPIVSSPMDTVTEYKMAVQMARMGGLGIIHRYMPISEQADNIRKVKRAGQQINVKPYLVGLNHTIRQVKQQIEITGVYTFLVTDDEYIQQTLEINKKNQFLEYKQMLKLSPNRKSSSQDFQNGYVLHGIVTRRDLKSSKSDSDKVKDIMTPREKLVTIRATEAEDKNLMLDKMINNKIEKIPVLDDDNQYVVGLVNLRDIEKEDQQQNKDIFGQLYVGAAVGAAKEDDLDRAVKLMEAGCDVLVVDIANGHSEVAVKAVKKFKELTEDKQIDIVAGSVATGQGAEALIKAGADGIRCGIGNGSICITRVVSGCGVPQFTALMDVAPVCKKYEIPLISDGGNKNSGNMCKALGVGANSIMLGRLVAGCEESPSQVIYREGKLQKVYRGMAGFGANLAKAQRIGGIEPGTTSFNPEGVEGYIPYAGPLEHVINQFTKGIQSGMSYCGARNIKELQSKVKFIRMTSSGFRESGVHNITQI